MNTDVQDRSRTAMRQAESMPSNFYFGGVIGSIFFSALLFLLGKKELALFVGLWPPTLLNMALFMKQLRPSREIDRFAGY